MYASHDRSSFAKVDEIKKNIDRFKEKKDVRWKNERMFLLTVVSNDLFWFFRLVDTRCFICPPNGDDQWDSESNWSPELGGKRKGEAVWSERQWSKHSYWQVCLHYINIEFCSTQVFIFTITERKTWNTSRVVNHLTLHKFLLLKILSTFTFIIVIITDCNINFYTISLDFFKITLLSLSLASIVNVFQYIDVTGFESNMSRSIFL